MKRALLSGLLLVTVASAQDLPPGEGRDLVGAKCQACHSLARIVSKQKDQAGWAATVARMRTNGLQASDPEVAKIVSYLAATFKPVAGAPAAPDSMAKPTQGTTPALNYDAARKTLSFTLVANMGDANRGLNFGGYFKGERTLTVPRGTRVEVLFSNAGQIPHSLYVVAGSTVPEMITPDAVALLGGSSKVARAGDPPQKVRFLANTAGDYLLVCGVGKHAMNGQFLKMVVSKDATEPSFK